MAKKMFRLGILVMVLVFGMTVIGCDNGNGNGGGTNVLDLYNWSDAPLTSQALSASGLTQAQFETIRNASGGGFLGWALVGSNFSMAWTGRSVANFNNVVDAIVGLPGRTERDRDVEDGIHIVEGNNFFVEYFSVRIAEFGLFMPSGTLWADLW